MLYDHFNFHHNRQYHIHFHYKIPHILIVWQFLKKCFVINIIFRSACLIVVINIAMKYNPPQKWNHKIPLVACGFSNYFVNNYLTPFICKNVIVFLFATFIIYWKFLSYFASLFSYLKILFNHFVLIENNLVHNLEISW